MIIDLLLSHKKLAHVAYYYMLFQCLFAPRVEKDVAGPLVRLKIDLRTTTDG